MALRCRAPLARRDATTRLACRSRSVRGLAFRQHQILVNWYGDSDDRQLRDYYRCGQYGYGCSRAASHFHCFRFQNTATDLKTIMLGQRLSNSSWVTGMPRAARHHVACIIDRSGRIEARSGLRMMPTFPRSPLSFRTAGFPQYGWKAGFSDGAFPASTRA